MNNELYDILGVPRHASFEDIRRAYKHHARTCHPDRRGRAEHFANISEAHEILSDPVRRAVYDNQGLQAARNHIQPQRAPQCPIATSLNVINNMLSGIKPHAQCPLAAKLCRRRNSPPSSPPFSPSSSTTSSFMAVSVATSVTMSPRLPAGSRVIVCNLQQDQGFNGKVGTIVSFDADAGRYVVTICQNICRLLPNNIRRVCARVQVIDTNVEGVNTKLADVIGFDDAQQLYQLQVECQSLMLPPEHIVFVAGTILRLWGLGGPCALYNDRLGQVEGFCPQRRIYVLRLQEGGQVQVPPRNVRPFSET